MPGPNKTKGVQKPKNTKKTVARLLSYLGKYKLLLGIVLVAVIASAGAGVAGSSMLKPAIDNYIVPLMNRALELKNAGAGETLTAADFLPFLKMLGVMALIYAAGALSTWINQRLMLYISTSTLFRIRTELFDELEKLPLKYYDGHTHGELMSLFTNDTDTLRDLMSQSLPQLLSSTITIISVFVMMVIVSPLLTVLVIVTIFLMMLLAASIGKKSARAFREQQDALAKANGYIEELCSGQKVVKVFNREQQVKDDFNVINDRLCEAGTRANTYANILMPIMGNFSHIQYAVVAVAGVFLVIYGKANPASVIGLSFGSIAAFLEYTRNFSRPVTMMSQQFNGILNALAGAERIFAVIDEENEVDEGKVTLVNATYTSSSASSDGKEHLVQTFGKTGQWAWSIPHEVSDRIHIDDQFEDGADRELVLQKGEVIFTDVCFGYVPEKEVLHHINIHAHPGKKIALVGSTGSGKTTVTNLLTRFYDIEEGKGSITYDGIPLKEIRKDDLRRGLGMVLQDTHLFTGTIKDNIKYGNLDASDAQVYEAARLANADTFIRHLEKGYDTVISGDGGNLSQGQRQLLAIARAAVENPPVLILDEATSSIDTRTELLIQQGMDSLMKGRTSFVIAHRLSTIKNSDEILVLEKGNIIERGNHDQLMAQKGRYYELYTGGSLTQEG